jgi:23S rRNA pseudouridine2605 synthase
VQALERTRFGPLDLGGLEPGRWRRLTPAEVERLRA